MKKEEREKYTKETTKIIMESKDIRSEILVIHLALEQLINKALKKVFKNSEILLNKSFSTKIDILYALGFEEILIQDIRTVNKIRNIFAHELFSQKKIPKEIETKISNHVNDIINRNITDESRRKKLIDSTLQVKLSGACQAVIIKLIASI